MSEADFFPASGGQYRGSKYPGFSSGATDSSGNVQAVGTAANVSQASGNNLSPGQVQQKQVDTGNTSAQTGGSLGTPQTTTPASSALNQQSPSQTTLGGMVAQSVLPAAGNIAGSAAGSVLGGGGSLGEAIGAGGEALSNTANNLAHGNFGSSLLSSSAGAVGGAASLSSAGISNGLPAINVGTAGVDKLGENAISNGVGASAASEGAALGGSALSGVGTFAAGLISGQNVGQAAISGIGAGAGTYLGYLAAPFLGPLAPIAPIVGSFLGSMLGGLFGNKHPTVGPNGDTLLTVDNGQLGVGLTGADNGADPGITENAARESTTAINKILTEHNLTIDPSKLTAFGNDGKYYNELSITQGSVNSKNPHSALDVWNNLLKANAIVSKTPNNEVPAAATNSVNVVRGNTPAPATASTQPKVLPLTGAI